ncbi:MAG: MFS transporter [Proteobacteria bacterium]|nr:MFS transporter [Pseudomonadota bacterium]
MSLAPVAALLLSVFILLVGNGLQGTVLPIRANIEGFSALGIGGIGAAYYLGFTIGCIAGPVAIKRVGHIRAFAALAAIAAASSMLHALMVSPFPWYVFRCLTGVCFAGLYMIIESWLNERSTNETRGRVLSIYQIVNLTAITGGQFLLNAADPAGFELFAIVTVLIALGLVPVALTTATAPRPIQQTRLRIGWLYGISPVAVLGCIAVGLANGAFWGLAPVHARLNGLPVSEIAVFMAVTIIGGAILQFPLGRLSDHYDRRYVLIAACLLCALAGLGLAMLGDGSHSLMLAMAFLFGGFAFPIYALSIAHANDLVEPGDRVNVSSGLLLVFGLSAVVGPVIASAVMEMTSYQSLFIFTAVVHVITAAFAYYRTTRRKALAASERDGFVMANVSSPAVFGIDPRMPEPPSGRPAEPETDGDAEQDRP